MFTLKSSKTALLVIVFEAVVCVVLGVWAFKSHSQLSGKDDQIKQLTEQSKGFQDMVGVLSKENESLQKTTVPRDEYARVVNGVFGLKNTAVASGLLSISSSYSRPDQICEALRPLLMGAPASKSGAADVDMFAGAVEKEIAARGAIDTKDTAKNALSLFHMQQVFNAIGYGLSGQMQTTNDAAVKFQTDNGLKPDGKIGAKTWAKVRELWNAKNPNPQPQPQAQPKPQSKTQP